MTDVNPVSQHRPPRHLMVVGVVALLWNAVGAFDYLMTETGNSWYMSSFTADQIAYFRNLPKWVISTWAIGVWGGVAASLLLLLRRRLAAMAFAISLASAALTFLYNFGLSDGLQIMGGRSALVVPGVVLLIGILLLLYSRGMVEHGYLR